LSLSRLYDEYWDYILREFPVLATYLGDHRFDDRLDNFSAAGFERHAEQFRTFKHKLKSFAKPTRTRDRLNYELFEKELTLHINSALFKPYLLPITHLSGPHVDLPRLTSFHPFNSRQDLQNYLTRLHQLPVVFNEIIECMRIGIKERITLPMVIIEKIVPQIETQIVKESTKSGFFVPTVRSIRGISKQEISFFEDDLSDVILGPVNSSYSRLLSFMKSDYHSASRKEIGLWAVPRGKEWYQHNIESYTSTSLTPKSIHRIGLHELAKIQKAIRLVIVDLGFRGTLHQFSEFVRRDRSQYFKTGDEILSLFKKILSRVEPKLPSFFGTIPTAGYQLREVEAFRSQTAPAAFYSRPPEDGSRPGCLYVNTFKPDSRPKYMMEALAYHEVLPGHHLQVSLQQESASLPRFRRHGGYSAFEEGWALYAEELGKEMGFYEDLLSEFGRLMAEARRAARLVVDTGIHTMRWTRGASIRFLKHNLSANEQETISEIDRFIAWPGQALGYKIGQLRIQDLRSRAQTTLGARFDLRLFHDKLLSQGALPLDMLEKFILEWIAKRMRR